MAPKHIDTTRAADSGASAAYWPLMRGAHSDTFRDVWATDRDVAKNWGK